MKYKIFFLLLLVAPIFSGCVRHTQQKDKIALRLAPAKPMHKELIVIDAGHGGKDSGSRSETYAYEEKRLTLSTAHMLADSLKELGYRTIMTREQDAFVSLDDRAEVANSNKCTLFVSVHFNHCPTASVEGIEIFYYKDEKSDRHLHSKKLGDTILSQLVYHTGAKARGVKTGKFAVIRQTKMPAVLVEAGFLSHPKEREKIKDPLYRRFIARGIARGIDNFLNGK